MNGWMDRWTDRWIDKTILRQEAGECHKHGPSHSDPELNLITCFGQWVSNKTWRKHRFGKVLACSNTPGLMYCKVKHMEECHCPSWGHPTSASGQLTISRLMSSSLMPKDTPTNSATTRTTTQPPHRHMSSNAWWLLEAMVLGWFVTLHPCGNSFCCRRERDAERAVLGCWLSQSGRISKCWMWKKIEGGTSIQEGSGRSQEPEEGGKGKRLEKKEKEFCTRGWAAQVKKISTPKRLWCASPGQRIGVGLGAKSLERGTA